MWSPDASWHTWTHFNTFYITKEELYKYTGRLHLQRDSACYFYYIILYYIILYYITLSLVSIIDLRCALLNCDCAPGEQQKSVWYLRLSGELPDDWQLSSSEQNRLVVLTEYSRPCGRRAAPEARLQTQWFWLRSCCSLRKWKRIRNKRLFSP